MGTLLGRFDHNPLISLAVYLEIESGDQRIFKLMEKFADHRT